MPRTSAARKVEPQIVAVINVNAIELLTSQHREVDKLFDEFEQLGERAFKARMQTFEKIAHTLTCHSMIEEKIFYPAARKFEKETTLEAYEEHDVLKSLMKKISLLEPGDETFLAKVRVMKEIVQHHVKEEEGEFFLRVRKNLGDDILIELGTQMQVMFDKLDATHPEPTPRYLKKAK
ncbi:MAG: hemerythrin domain-containing protein [Chitinophagaceae bacterium]|nr:hemerythrin domain-containing protein [Oligoflexus sp.]